MTKINKNIALPSYTAPAFIHNLYAGKIMFLCEKLNMGIKKDSAFTVERSELFFLPEMILIIASFMDVKTLILLCNTSYKLNELLSNDKRLWKNLCEQDPITEKSSKEYNKQHGLKFLEAQRLEIQKKKLEAQKKALEAQLEAQRVVNAFTNSYYSNFLSNSNLESPIKILTIFEPKKYAKTSSIFEIHRTIDPNANTLHTLFTNPLKNSRILVSNQDHFTELSYEIDYNTRDKQKKKLAFQVSNCPTTYLQHQNPNKDNDKYIDLLYAHIALAFIETSEQAKAFIKNIFPTHKHKLLFLVSSKKIHNTLEQMPELKNLQIKFICADSLERKKDVGYIFKSIATELEQIEVQKGKKASVSNSLSNFVFGRK